MIPLDTIILVMERINEQLRSEIPQRAKKNLCTVIERLLMDANCYGGFNHNHWLEGGCQQWKDSGIEPDHDESCTKSIESMSSRQLMRMKNPYIIGRIGDENKDNDDFVHGVQGEYSRSYFCCVS